MSTPPPAAEASNVGGAAPAAGTARTRGPVHVVGAGLLGTSVGLALRARGVDVVLTDVSPSAAALARDLGAGRRHRPGDAPPALVVVAALVIWALFG